MADCGVFLDRDGTINHEVSYLRDVSQFALIAGAAEGIRLLNQAGFKVVVVTNQAAIARGYLTESTLEEVHRVMQDQLRRQQAVLDEIYYCPHHPTEGNAPYRVDCECRKPKPGMLTRAAKELGIDLARSFLVGDKRSDLEAGRRAGCRTVLVRTGYGKKVEESLAGGELQPDWIAEDLLSAVKWVLER